MGQRKGVQQIPAYRRHSSGQARVVIAGPTHYLGKYGFKISRQRYDPINWLAYSGVRLAYRRRGELAWREKT